MVHCALIHHIRITLSLFRFALHVNHLPLQNSLIRPLLEKIPEPEWKYQLFSCYRDIISAIYRSEVHDHTVTVRYGLILQVYLSANQDHLTELGKQQEVLLKLGALSAIAKNQSVGSLCIFHDSRLYMAIWNYPGTYVTVNHADRIISIFKLHVNYRQYFWLSCKKERN